MPELPEVETVVRGLRPALLDRRIARADLRRPDLRFPLPERFAERLEGRTVTDLRRRAKYILATLDSGEVWLTHLGMTGRFTIDAPPDGRASAGQAGHNSGWALVAPHDHLVIETETGQRVTFNDARRFGYMDLLPPGTAETSRYLKDLGPEPLSDAFNAGHMTVALAGKRTPIKAALLDQKVVAGLGNIYVCEALWRAGISPKRSAHTIPGARARRLVPAIKAVLQAAIAAGGSSLRDYRQTSGELGYFQHAWDVYDRENTPCRQPGCTGTIRRIVQSGRSSFYCPAHQR
ncbi:bifunctional DNA-formamidopyrimidine glycosylase/DNA-(apurinic or apyrimidinic site) lyase [Marivibrio halodurans]|uniref:Formamidopyrimidine-DNA glycosylase n=1 Tax=Marivibrio halodurans TaxID=2039722 RepID=A0A8J7S0G8_9PROT|nr:bifunctional DNA-formamidopyrimidine glycosylase/DNA-(apurinic or apyrimidinic site) lyase [Marivibrio halodurans]MBP5858050.1 bifunctional DNA-formamidopyrimidine glycosylase/DNA-(apurinic or apyrimidinic site) lyase [Marivibrio halodurans]